MCVPGDLITFSEKAPRILFQQFGEARMDVWFPPTECEVATSDLDDVCQDLYQRSHGAIRVETNDLGWGVLTIQRNPTILSRIDLEDAAERLAKRLCETCPENKNYHPAPCE